MQSGVAKKLTELNCLLENAMSSFSETLCQYNVDAFAFVIVEEEGKRYFELANEKDIRLGENYVTYHPETGFKSHIRYPLQGLVIPKEQALELAKQLSDCMIDAINQNYIPYRDDTYTR